MRVVIFLGLCALAAAAPKDDLFSVEQFKKFEAADSRNILISAILSTLFDRLRILIREGSEERGIPVLDPLEIDNIHLKLPAGIINLDLQLKNSRLVGLGDFVLHSRDLNVHDLYLDVDMSVPTLDISAENYDLTGDLFNAIPLYGRGGAVFRIDGFRFDARFYLKQSEDGKSILIDRIENLKFVFPGFRSNLDGAIGGGSIDNIVNALTEEVIFNYVNRFHGAIANVASGFLTRTMNSALDGLDTWRFLAAILPK